MKIQYSLFLPLLLLFVLDSSANSTKGITIDKSLILNHQFETQYGDTYFLKDSSVFVAKNNADGAIISTTLFYSGSIDKNSLVSKMIWVLEATNASTKFVNWAKKNMSRNRRFEKDSFIMPLKSFDMTTHEFTFSNTGHNQLYILSYRRLKPEL